ncbi:MAG: efflux RND transporter periplasmic adaptor subunit [Breznakibacter sp.]
MVLKNILIAGVSVFLLASCQRPSMTKEVAQKAIKVETTVVKASQGEKVLSYSGSIVPFQSIPVAFRTSGTVQTVLVEEGMPVRKGQALAVLDKTDLQNLYNASEAQYEQALDAYNRLKEVYQKGSLAEIKWVEMESNLKQAESSMNLAKSNLEKAVLTSPENGVVGKRNIEPGMSSLGINTPFEVVKIDKIYVRISVPESEISSIRKGMEANFTVSAVGGKKYKGNVSVVGVVADRISRTYEVKVLADNPSQEIKPGMVCDVTVACDPRQVLAVDYSAVTHGVDGAFVFKVSPDNTSVVKQPITVGQMTRDGIEILAGLNEGDVVVSQGKDKLKENSQITL